jgi:multidrug efflux pump subunit AcrB
MTTLAAVIALLRLAFGIGQGSSMLKLLATAIVSGLVFQLPPVLIVLPCLLALFRHGPRAARTNTREVPPLVSSAT